MKRQLCQCRRFRKESPLPSPELLGHFPGQFLKVSSASFLVSLLPPTWRVDQIVPQLPGYVILTAEEPSLRNTEVLVMTLSMSLVSFKSFPEKPLAAVFSQYPHHCRVTPQPLRAGIAVDSIDPDEFTSSQNLVSGRLLGNLKSSTTAWDSATSRNIIT